MNKFEEILKDYLLQFKGLPANHLTHALKLMSDKEDGTMIDGIIEIIDRLISNQKRSVTTAFWTGSIGTALVVSVLGIYFKHKENKKNEEKYQKIIKTFENEIALAKSSINSITKEPKSNTESTVNYE